jgi:hypothetical protein
MVNQQKFELCSDFLYVAFKYVSYAMKGWSPFPGIKEAGA